MKLYKKYFLVVVLATCIIIAGIFLYSNLKKVGSNKETIQEIDIKEYPLIQTSSYQNVQSLSNKERGEYCYLNKDKSDIFINNFDISLSSFSPNNNSTIYVPTNRTNFVISGYKENFEFKISGEQTHLLKRSGENLIFEYELSIASDNSKNYWDVLIGDFENLEGLRKIRVLNYELIAPNSKYDNVDYFNGVSPYIDNCMVLDFFEKDCRHHKFPYDLFPVLKNMGEDFKHDREVVAIFDRPDNELLLFFYVLLGGDESDLFSTNNLTIDDLNHSPDIRKRMIDYLKNKNFILDSAAYKRVLKQNNNVLKYRAVMPSNFKNGILNLTTGILSNRYNPFPSIYKYNIEMTSIEITLKNKPEHKAVYNLPCDLSKIEKDFYNKEINIKLYRKNDLMGQFNAIIDKQSPIVIIEAQMQDGTKKQYCCFDEMTIYGEIKSIKVLDIYDKNIREDVYDYEYDFKQYRLKDLNIIDVDTLLHKLEVNDRAGNKTSITIHNTSINPNIEINIIKEKNKNEYLDISIFGDALINIDYAYVVIRKDGVIQEYDSDLKMVLPFGEYKFADYGLYEVDVIVGNKHISKSFEFLPKLDNIVILNPQQNNLYTGIVKFQGINNIDCIAYYNGTKIENSFCKEDGNIIFNPKERIEGLVNVIFFPKNDRSKIKEFKIEYDNLIPRICIRDLFSNALIENFSDINRPIRILITDRNLLKIELFKDNQIFNDASNEISLYDSGYYKLCFLDKVGLNGEVIFSINIKKQEDISMDLNNFKEEIINSINSDIYKTNEEIFEKISTDTKVNINKITAKQETLEKLLQEKFEDNHNMINKNSGLLNSISDNVTKLNNRSNLKGGVKLEDAQSKHDLKNDTSNSPKKNQDKNKKIRYILIGSSSCIVMVLFLALIIRNKVNKRKEEEVKE